jgi:hypothetical protein
MSEFIQDGILVSWSELILIVGMRGGKSFAGAHVGGYLEHMAAALGIEKPGTLQQMLGQEKSEWFEINFAASTEKQAEKTIYMKYRQMRRSSPWLNRYMNWVKEKEQQQIGVRDPWKYSVSQDEIKDGYLQLSINRVPSDSSGIAGATRLGAFLDEWARLIDAEGPRSASELYRVLNAGLRTVRTAVTLNKGIPFFFGMMAAITSTVADDDPAMQALEKAVNGVTKRTFPMHKATWEFNPFQPREAFDEEYERDPVAAERDFGANPPAAITPFITDIGRFWKAIDWNKKPIASFGITHPTDARGREYVGVNLEHCELDHVNKYTIFGDAGLSVDTFSLACGHPVWIPLESIAEGLDGEPLDVESFVDTSGRIPPPNVGGVVWPEQLGTVLRPDRGGDRAIIQKLQYERARMLQHGVSTPITGPTYPHTNEVLCTAVDFCVRIIPEPGRNVWFDSILDLVKGLSTQIKLQTACFDRWNSVSTIQSIRDMGIESYSVTLNMNDFLQFRNMTYNGRVFLLPPDEEDKVYLRDGKLKIMKNQELMSPHGVAVVELLKLSRSKDLKKVYNVNKGKVRGRDSDDIARCIMGLHTVIQGSEVDKAGNIQRKREIRERLSSAENPMSGNIFVAGRVNK